MRPDLRRLLSGLLVCAMLGLAVAGAAAQTASSGATPAEATAPASPEAAATTEAAQVAPAMVDPADQALIDSWRTRLDQIGANLTSTTATDDELVMLRRTVVGLHDQITPLIDRLQPRANALRARLAELSLPQDQSALEPETLKREREAQTRMLVSLEAVLKQAHATQLRTDEIVATIEERRRGLFAERVIQQSRSMLNPTLWRDVAAELPRALASLNLLMEDWSNLVRLRGGSDVFAGFAVLLLFAVVLIWPVRRYLSRRVNRDPNATSVTNLSKVAHAAAIASVNFGVVVVVMLGLIGLLDTLQLSPPRIDRTLFAVLSSLGLFAAIRGLGVAIVAPSRTAWRILPVADSAAETIMKWTVLYGGIFSLGMFVVRMSNVLALPLPVIQGLQGLFAMATAFTAMGALHAVARGLNEDSDNPDGGSIALWRWLLPPAWLAAIVAAIAPLAGYLTLGWFLVGQVVWIAVILAILFLALALADELITAAFRAGTTVGDVLSRNLRFRPATIEQLGAILSGFARLTIIAVAFALLLAPFGITGSDMLSTLRRSLTGLRIGSVTVSPAAIFGALLVFAVGVLATRAFQRWLDTRFLPHTRMDVGLKTSVRTGLGYLGVIAAGMVAFSVAGFNLQNVAIIAGALSVGVGFGLQSIVNNFVSGLILLAERPIKAGDWIVVGAEQGYVKRINVRSTEIETFDRSTVIVPNSDLISGVVKNWMHNDTSGRVIIDLRVPFDTDPDQVHDLLLEVAQSHPNVLAYPEPKVYLSNFGESALEFQIFCYLGNIDYMLSAKSELRFAAFRALRKNGIEIPYTRRDMHMLDIEALKQAPPAPVPQAPAPTRRRKRKPASGTDAPVQPREPLDLPDGDGDAT